MSTMSKRQSLPPPRTLQLFNTHSESHARASSSVSSAPDSPVSAPSALTRKPSTRRQSSIAYLPHDSSPRYDIKSPTRQDSIESSARKISPVEPQRTPPVTLADKHADLLRFIAQKESKCMELRSQLASHEDELIQLKRKWERIVNKGFDRVMSNAISIPQTPAAAPGQVLDGIKEGVQGVGRLLAAGLGDFTAPPPVVASRTHSTQQSTSSVTTTSSTSTRFSQSSMASSVAEDDFPLESPEEQDDGQVLIVEDSGPTPTVSPNPVMKSVIMEDKPIKTLRRRSRDAPPSMEAMPASSRETIRTKPANIVMTPVPSIPGLGTFPSGSPSWVMGTVNKKWEELQKTETFAKNQKRASILISDVSQSFLNAWASPMPSPGGTPIPTGNPFATAFLPASPSPMSRRTVSTSSLLDDDADTTGGLGAVMTPDSKLPTSVAKISATATDDEEEWNW